MNHFSSSLNLRGKFYLILTTQIVLMLCIALIGWTSLKRLHGDQATVTATINKLNVTTDVIANSNRLRIVHCSLLGAHGFPEYLAKRSKRLTEAETVLERDMTRLEAIDWGGEQTQVAEICRTIRHYSKSFAPLLKEVETNPRPNIPALMDTNLKELNEARDNLDKLQDLYQKKAETLSQTDELYARKQQIGMVLGVLVAIVLGIGLTLVVGRQVESEARSIEVAMEAMASGDLTQRCPEGSRDEFGRIAAKLNGAVARIREDFLQIATITERAASGATELAATTQQLEAATSDISRSADAQRLEVENSSKALQAVSQSVEDVRNRTAQAARLSEESLQASSKGMGSVQESTNAMAAIQESSDKVSKITTLIADIARQTNLLSLNAAIEAAKAGTHGKGFAVVAEEIRKLAERSASAAREISTLIQESGQRVGVGSKAVQEVHASLQLIQDNIRNYASQIKEIASSMAVQAQAKDQVVNGIQQTLGLTERNASATAELTATIAETANTVEDLARLASELRTLATHFRVH